MTTRFLRAREVAEALGLTKSTVYDLARRGVLPHVRIGSSVRFPERVLEELARRALKGGEHS